MNTQVTFGIDLGGTVIKAGLLDGKQLIVSKSIRASAGIGLRDNLPDIEKMIDEMIFANNLLPGDIIGIGFSFPGLVDSIHGKIISTNKKYDDAIDLDLPRWAIQKWRLPLLMENDARMALLGEWQYGAGIGFDNIVMVTLGTGIGSSVLIEGKLLKGKHFQAGNLGGHFAVNHRGTICTCGNIGCMEAEASTWRLPDLIKSYSSYPSSSLSDEKLLDFEILFKHATKHDPLSEEVLDHCFSVWSSGLITMIHAFDPDIIIIGGGIMNSGSVIIPEIQRRINLHAWTPWGKVKLLKAQNINTSALYGADYLVRSHGISEIIT